MSTRGMGPIVDPSGKLFGSTVIQSPDGRLFSALDEAGSGDVNLIGGGSFSNAAGAWENIVNDAAGATGAGGGRFDWFSSLFHTGGVADIPGAGRYLPPALFDDTPRLHNGYAAHEFPAVLHRDERVLSPPRNDQFEALLERWGRSGAAQTRQRRGGEASPAA